MAARSKTILESPIDDRLLEGFYKPVRSVPPAPAPPLSDEQPPRARPTHYKVCCISLYTEDIERLEAMVKELKRRGHTRANKSQLIRAALDQVDLSKVPKNH